MRHKIHVVYTTPSLAIPKALKAAGLDAKDIGTTRSMRLFRHSYCQQQEAGLDPAKVNVNGGPWRWAIPWALRGQNHYHAGKRAEANNASVGIAAICNGGAVHPQ